MGMAKSLCCSPETTTTLLISYTPIQNKKFKMKKKQTKIMASSIITSWLIEGEKVEAVTDFIFFCSKITADGDCSHEIKRCLLLGRKAMTNLESLFKAETSLCQQRSV